MLLLHPNQRYLFYYKDNPQEETFRATFLHANKNTIVVNHYESKLYPNESGKVKWCIDTKLVWKIESLSLDCCLPEDILFEIDNYY